VQHRQSGAGDLARDLVTDGASYSSRVMGWPSFSSRTVPMNSVVPPALG
jgi:hypothetical protein